MSIIGKIVSKVNWVDISEGEINSIEFTDGSQIIFRGSSQIGESAVWAEVENNIDEQ